MIFSIIGILRMFFGVEIENKYCLLAAKRLDMAKLEPSIQGYTNGVFWERNTLSIQKAKTKKNKHGPRAGAGCLTETSD